MLLNLEHSKTSFSLDHSEDIQAEAASLHDGASKIPKVDTAYELHPLPTQLHERSRRLSATVSRFDKSLFDGDDCLKTVKYVHDAPSSNVCPTANPASHGSRVELSTLSEQQKKHSLIQFAAICWSFWLVGWNDGSLGPLLPRIQHDYQLGYSIVSLIFVGNCAGFITGSALNVWFNERYGLGKVFVAGALTQFIGYTILISSPPFPLIICAYFFLGFGISLQIAQGNGFVGSLRQHMTLKLGLVHGAYGLGAFTSPFSATYFSTLTDRKWAFHFILSAAFSIVNAIVLICVFRFRSQEDVLRDAGQEPQVENTTQPEGSVYRQISRLKAMPWLTIFALIYIGVEVTLGGWMVSFIIRERHGGSSSGYISSGFFGGLTAGRVCLIWLNDMVGARRIIFIYTVIAIGLELTVWFIPSIIENGIAISITGLVLGPMYPLLVSHMTHILPHWLLTGCIGLVTGLGMAGSAVLPFVTGLLASKFGIGSLQPLMISMMGCMVFIWALVPGGN